MGLAAFNRMRREQAEKEKLETEKELLIDYTKLTKDELKDLLNEGEIKFDEKAKKDELIVLLQGRE